ncbi:hypothetical protein [Streptomyces sp. NPDC047315]|uniref:hypothetical protein n=1 Tax=Streptomyces sp. NPDC047315 TaxID=3155142 RepID=UPI0033D84659
MGVGFEAGTRLEPGPPSGPRASTKPGSSLAWTTVLAFVSIVITAEPEEWRSHQIVRDAIARGDGDAATAEMADHLAQVIEALRTPDNVVPSKLDARRRGTGRHRPSKGLTSMRLEDEDLRG